MLPLAPRHITITTIPRTQFRHATRRLFTRILATLGFLALFGFLVYNLRYFVEVGKIARLDEYTTSIIWVMVSIYFIHIYARLFIRVEDWKTAQSIRDVKRDLIYDMSSRDEIVIDAVLKEMSAHISRLHDIQARKQVLARQRPDAHNTQGPHWDNLN